MKGGGRQTRPTGASHGFPTGLQQKLDAPSRLKGGGSFACAGTLPLMTGGKVSSPVDCCASPPGCERRLKLEL